MADDPEHIFERHGPQSGENVYIERRPVPDPTQLTTTAIARDVAALKELVVEKIEASRKIIQAQVEGHWSLDLERFRAVDLRFNERDIRFSQAAADNSEALKSALASTNSATVRLENTFSKQIDTIGERLDKQVAGMVERITDLKDRIVAIEGQHKGSGETIGWVIGAAGVFIAIISIVFAIIRSMSPIIESVSK
jgi:hypothetical protein